MIESRPARLTPSPAPPTGAASGVLNGTYPGPGLADGVVTPAKLSGVGPSDVGAAAALHASRHATDGADPITPASIGAASIGAALKTASAAGQIPVSDGAGTSYPARARLFSGTAVQRDALSALDGDEWYVSSGAGVGTLWKRMNSAWKLVATGTDVDTILATLGGIKAPSSPSVGDVLTHDGSAWVAAAPSVGGPSAITYTMGGSVVDYTVDAAYSPSGLTSLTGTSLSGRLGDGVIVPYFTAFRKGEFAALARTAIGLRLTYQAGNSPVSHGTPYPYFEAGACIRIPLDLPHDVQVDFTVAVNFDGARAVGGSDLIQTYIGLARHADEGGRSYTIAAVWLSSYAVDSAGAAIETTYALSDALSYQTTDTSRDVSSSGEGTTGGITVRDVRMILKGDTVEILTGPSGGALTRRLYYADVDNMDGRDGVHLLVSISQMQSTPQAGYWVEPREIVITPL